MGLSIKNEQVEQLARELAKRRSITVTEAIRQSLEREVARDRLVPRKEDADSLYQKLLEIAERAASLPTNNDLTDDEILGYDEIGAPTR
jgi:antitoxin VapB